MPTRTFRAWRSFSTPLREANSRGELDVEPKHAEHNGEEPLVSHSRSRIVYAGSLLRLGENVKLNRSWYALIPMIALLPHNARSDSSVADVTPFSVA
jgi:hypothetical protein